MQSGDGVIVARADIAQVGSSVADFRTHFFGSVATEYSRCQSDSPCPITFCTFAEYVHNGPLCSQPGPCALDPDNDILVPHLAPLGYSINLYFISKFQQYSSAILLSYDKSHRST